MATSSPPPRRRRVWWKITAGLLAVLLAGVAAIPWLLGTLSAREWLISRANRAMTPGGFEFSTIRFSWLGPTRLTGFVLRDAQGDRVVDASTATWDRNLRQILFDRPRYGTLTLDRAVLDVERRADGTVDLYETIKPLLGLNRETSLRILVRQGRLRYRDSSQTTPVTAEQADLAVEIQSSPSPITWDIRLEKPGIPTSTLELRGDYNRWKGTAGRPADLTVQLRGMRWPWTVSGPGLETSGRFGGRISAKRRNGEWNLDGRADIDDLGARGPTLAGDNLKLERVAATWDLAGRPGSWQVRNLELTSPIGNLKAAGTLQGTREDLALIEGNLDLAALARQIPRALHLREGISVDRGEAKLRIESRAADDGQAWNVQAHISDLEAHDGGRPLTLREPATLSARILRRASEIKVEELALRTSFLDLKAKGDVDHGVGWSGTFELGGLQRELKSLVEFGKVELGGKGDLSGTYRRTAGSFQGRLEFDVANLQVAGLADRPFARDSAHATVTAGG
ncbi:AsmA family protein, partial [Singulisphaera rosea]